MKALITGAGGQLGQALRRTAPAEAHVTAVSRADLDIADAVAVADTLAAVTPTVVINAAAFTAVDRAETEYDAAMRANRDGPAVLAKACEERGIHLIHLSTDFVFDGSAAKPIAPDAPVSPIGVYGVSKAAGEEAVLASKVEAAIVRTAWVYGHGAPNFVATMLRLAGQGRDLRVVADQVGTPTHTDSLARACWAMAQLRVTGIYHFTDAGVASWYDFAVAIVEDGQDAGLVERPVGVVPIRTVDYPTPAQRPSYSVLDKTTTWDVLGAPAAHWRHELRVMLREQKALAR